MLFGVLSHLPPLPLYRKSKSNQCIASYSIALFSCSPSWDTYCKLLKDKPQNLQSRAARLVVRGDHAMRSVDILDQ